MNLLPDIARDSLIDDAVMDAVVVYSLSGGKDCGGVSAAVNAHLDRIGHPRGRRFAMHADLGRAEWLHTPAQVEAQANALGVPLIVVRRKAGDLVARFENRWQLGLKNYVDLRLYNMRGPWSSPSLKFCQSETKIQVMGPEVARRFRGQTVIQVTGLRRDESAARRSTAVAKVDTRFVKPGNRGGTRVLIWNPGVDMTADQVIATNVHHGIPLAMTYGLGCTRHSCRFCIMASENDLHIAANYPPNRELFLHYAAMEISSTFSFQAERWLADFAPQILTADQVHALARAKAAAAHRRAIEASMPARHRYVDGWPLHVPDHGEAVIIAAVRQELLAFHGLTSPYVTPGAVIDRFAELLAMQAAKQSSLTRRRSKRGTQ